MASFVAGVHVDTDDREAALRESHGRIDAIFLGCMKQNSISPGHAPTKHIKHCAAEIQEPGHSALPMKSLRFQNGYRIDLVKLIWVCSK